MAEKKTSIGGQALIEGIMMRGPERTAMAVRNAKKEIVLEEWATDTKVPKFWKLPFFRGIYSLVVSYKTGYKCLMRSADISISDLEEAEKEAAAQNVGEQTIKAEEAAKAEEEVTAAAEAIPAQEDGMAHGEIYTGGISEEPENVEKETPAETEAEETAKELPSDTGAENTDKELPSDTGDKNPAKELPADNGAEIKAKEEKSGSDHKALMVVITIISLVLGIGLAVSLFIFIPSVIARLVISGDVDSLTGKEALLRSVLEGLIKIVLLVLYMWAVSFMPDIKRTFMYHGAEHKTIFCYEHGLPLTVENVRKERRFHPRCGTSFLILMLIVGICIGFFIRLDNAWLRTAIKLALLPLTVGIGYELIKFAGRHDNILTRIISFPGVMLQHITTREPDDSMIECAIAAMEKVIPEDKTKDNW